MSRARRVALLTVAVCAVTGAGALAGDDDEATRVFTLEPPTGNPEGVAFDSGSGSFFVSSVGNGTIYRGTTGGDTATAFLPGGEDGRTVAVGLKAQDGLLYVAGGPTGRIFVYDIESRELVASFETGAGGFINDLAVSRAGDIVATDSFRPFLYRITAGQVAAGGGTPEAIPVEPEIAYQAGFNLNGVVISRNGRRLVVVQANTGKLFRVTLEDDGREIEEIEVEGGPLLRGDGLLRDRGRLVVVQNSPPDFPGGVLTFVKLRGGGLSGEVEERRTDPTFQSTSTAARAEDLYLVVNSEFSSGDGAPPFTVSGVPR